MDKIEFKETNGQYHATLNIKHDQKEPSLLRCSSMLKNGVGECARLAACIVSALDYKWKVTIRSTSDIYVLGEDGVCFKELVLPSCDITDAVILNTEILQISDDYNRIVMNLKDIEYMEFSAIPRNYQGMGPLYAATIKVTVHKEDMDITIQTIQPNIVDDIFKVSLSDMDNRIRDPYEIANNNYIVVSEKQLTNLLWRRVKRNHASSSQINTHRYPMLVSIMGHNHVSMVNIGDLNKAVEKQMQKEPLDVNPKKETTST